MVKKVKTKAKKPVCSTILQLHFPSLIWIYHFSFQPSPHVHKFTANACASLPDLSLHFRHDKTAIYSRYDIDTLDLSSTHLLLKYLFKSMLIADKLVNIDFFACVIPHIILAILQKG